MIKNRQLAQVLLGGEPGQQHANPGTAVEHPPARGLKRTQVLPGGQVHPHHVVQPRVLLWNLRQAEHSGRHGNSGQDQP